MKIGIIGPNRCTEVDISAELAGIVPTEIISTGNMLWGGFYQAYLFAKKNNIPYVDVNSIISNRSRSGRFFLRDGTDEQYRWIIDNCDRLLLFCYDVAQMQSVINYAWKNNVITKVIKTHNNTTPSIDSYKTLYIRKDWHYIEEYHDKEYERSKISEYIYQFEELFDPGHDHLRLEINNGEIEVSIIGIDFKWIEESVKKYAVNVCHDTRVDYILSYKKGIVNEVIFYFNGYSGYHKEEDCITLQQQFDIIHNSEDLQACSYCSFGELPKLKRFFK